MDIRYENGKFFLYGADGTQLGGPYDSSLEAEAARTALTGSSGGDTGGNIGGIARETEAWRKAHPREYDQLQKWNQQQKEAKGIQLDESDADRAMGYMDPLDLDFWHSLNLYSQYIGGKEVNVPSPNDLAPMGQYGPTQAPSQDEINRLRGIAGIVPTEAGAPTPTVTGAPTTTPPRVLTADQQKYWDQAIQVAQQKGLPDPGAFARLLLYESGLNPGSVNSTSGAAGIAQFMPGTAAAYGINPMNPDEAIPAAAQLLLDNYNSLQARFGMTDWRQAYAAYFYGATGIGDIIEANGANWEAAIDPAYAADLNFAMGGAGLGAGTQPAAAGATGAPGYVPPGAPALELTTTEGLWNAALPKPLPEGRLLQYKQEHPELSGKALVDSLYAAYHTVDPETYPLSTEEGTIAKLRAAHPKAAAWSDDDWRYFIANEMTLEDMRAAEAAGQTPQAYVAKSLQEFSAFLKTNKLTLQEFQQASKIISDAEMQDAIVWGTGNPGYMKEYIEARRQGLGHGDIQRGYVAGESPLQTTVRIQTELAKEAETARLTAAREEALKAPEYQTGVGAEIAAEMRAHPEIPLDTALSNALGPRIGAEMEENARQRQARWQAWQRDRMWPGAAGGGVGPLFSGVGGFWGLGGPPGLPPAMSWELGRRLNAIFAAATPEQRLEAYRKAGYSEAEAAAQPGAAGATPTGVPQLATAAARGTTPTAAPATAGAQATILQGAGGTKYNPATGQWQVVTRPVTPEKVNAVTPEPVAARWKYNPATGRWGVPTRAVTPEKVNRVTPEPATVATPEPIDWTKWKPWAQTAAAAATPQPATAEARAYGGLAMMRRGTSKKAPAAAGFRKRKASGLTAL